MLTGTKDTSMNVPPWVRLDRTGAGRDVGQPGTPAWAPSLLPAAADSHGSAEPMISAVRNLDRDTARSLPMPGEGRTLELWELLATVASADLVAARVLEPHLDALVILHQAGLTPPPGLLGVYASESGGQTARAVRRGEGWVLTDTKPWCSLASRAGAAVVTAALPDGGRQAFLVDLADPGVQVGDDAWPALGLAAITSTPITFRDVPAAEVGPPGWYLSRPGFAWGGIGVAAVWFGGAVHLMRTLRNWLEASAHQGRAPDQLALATLGRVDRLLFAAATELATAAHAIDAGRLTGDRAAVDADRVRGTVAQMCAEVIDAVGQATGPGPLTADAGHARAVADLQVYVRQHHGARDDARLGEVLLNGTVGETDGESTW